jgi:prepilin-type N-terminal cleavage/methylation domain-containing protein
MEKQKKRKANMSRKKGFTLIELLVVIAIIALLLSIILPSLRMAKEYAMRLRCANNLKSLGQVLNLYAQQYKDFLPEAYYAAHPSGAASYFMFLIDPALPRETRIKEKYNMGPLWTLGLIDIGATFYCPSNQKTPFSYDAYGGPENWPSVVTALVGSSENPNVVRIGYSYLPQSSQKKMTVGSRTFPEVAKRLSQTHPRYSVALDVLQTRERMSHQRGGYAGANLLYSDSSVQFRSNSAILKNKSAGSDFMTDPLTWRSLIQELE